MFTLKIHIVMPIKLLSGNGDNKFIETCFGDLSVSDIIFYFMVK